MTLSSPALSIEGRRRFRPGGAFGKFVARRFAALVLLSIGITFVAFMLTVIVPGDPARAALGPIQGANPGAIAAWNAKYGLNKPLPVQYGLYLEHLLHGNLGTSQVTGDSVTSDLALAIPATAELGLVSLLISLPLGVLFGLLSALRRDRMTDHVVRFGSLSTISIPVFWIALVLLYVFFFKLGWVPGGGRLSPGLLPPPKVTGMYTVDALLAGDYSTFLNALDHMILPALVLATYNLGYVTRYTRAAVLEVVHSDFVRAAYAKGLRSRTVVTRYVLRAALPSMVQILGFAFAGVLTGAVLVETIFGWQGVGQYAYTSSVNLDLPAIMGVSLFIAIVYIVTNFVVDVLYAVIDPRIRLA